MTRKALLTTCALAACLLMFSGCASAPKQIGHEELVSQSLPSTTDVAVQWRDAMDRGVAQDGWIKSFNAPDLVSLVEEALKNNRSLVSAASNMEIAQALAEKAGANLVPAASIGGTGTRTEGEKGTTNRGGVALNISWELDIWGRLSAAEAAAQLGFLATEAQFDGARSSLVAQTAKSYFLATETLQQMKLAQKAVIIFEQLVSIAKARSEAGRVSSKDLHLAQADLASAEDRLRYCQSAYDQSIRSLEVLLGRYPSADLEAAKEFPPLTRSIPAGIPSNILERRPDLIALEHRVAASFEKVREAKAAKLPSFSLTGSAGRSSTELGDILSVAQNFWSIGANFLAPLDLGGGLEAQVNIETAKQKAALADYGQAALVAFSEVENALTNERLMAEREEFLSLAASENAQAFEIAEAQYGVGKISMLQVLQLQARELNSRIALTRIRSARRAQRVDLHLALGGDFE